MKNIILPIYYITLFSLTFIYKGNNLNDKNLFKTFFATFFPLRKIYENKIVEYQRLLISFRPNPHAYLCRHVSLFGKNNFQEYEIAELPLYESRYLTAWIVNTAVNDHDQWA